ncbi:MAG: long-chain fatty acid--CoA ligase [Deltaproteobacteria bacterium]|nr:long-chain fatty acid--CoA ligase [Deltaproteobacteria bacterium]MBW2667123.1 long-chain fatty acid--CoA ligase [Deltaproteobacteria bacterium]
MSGPTRDPRRADLDRRVLDWLQEPDFRSDDARFDALARDLFAFQYEHCAAYGAFCRGRGHTPETLRDWREIPAVPTGAFKEMALHSFPAEREIKCFRTSGTSTTTPGTLHLDTLELYEASLLPTFRRYLLPDLAPHARLPIRVLAPSADEAPTSSLSHMFAIAIREFGNEHSGFDVSGGELRSDGLCAALEGRAAEGEAIALCGTAFAFVHLLDDLEQRRVQYRLPDGSRLMECGGFKGRSREIPRPELYARLEDALGIPIEHMLNQYGMTELGSQFYDSVLVQPEELRRKLGPPWVRVALVDPNSGAPAAHGDTGQIVIYDLANTGSVFAIQTADLGRAIDDGFEVLGREPGAEARGCSIAADAMLGGRAR